MLWKQKLGQNTRQLLKTTRGLVSIADDFVGTAVATQLNPPPLTALRCSVFCHLTVTRGMQNFQQYGFVDRSKNT